MSSYFTSPVVKASHSDKSESIQQESRFSLTPGSGHSENKYLKMIKVGRLGVRILEFRS